MIKKVFFSLLCLTLINSLTHGLAQGTDKKVVMIVASSNFRDEELILPKNTLENAGFEVILASSSLSPAEGMLGTKIKPDILIQDVKIEDFEAVIFVGGAGAKEYWDNSTVHSIAIQAENANKIIGAICIAPVTLAKAGILEGRKATVWQGVAGELKSRGVNYTGNTVEIDKNIITADGPEAAEEFGEVIVSTLRGN